MRIRLLFPGLVKVRRNMAPVFTLDTCRTSPLRPILRRVGLGLQMPLRLMRIMCTGDADRMLMMSPVKCLSLGLEVIRKCGLSTRPLRELRLLLSARVTRQFRLPIIRSASLLVVLHG